MKSVTTQAAAAFLGNNSGAASPCWPIWEGDRDGVPGRAQDVLSCPWKGDVPHDPIASVPCILWG